MTMTNKTNENKCIMRSVCQHAGNPKYCNDICPLYIMMHGGGKGIGGRVQQANIPRDYRYYTIERNPIRESQPKATYIIEEWAKKSFPRMLTPESERIKPLYLWSHNKGTGKTSMACAIANSFMVYHVTECMKNNMQPLNTVVYFLDFNDWQTKFNQFNNPNVPAEFKKPASYAFYSALKKAEQVPLLVIDEIGIREMSTAFGQIAHDLINHRVSNRMPVIYTSNVPIEDLFKHYDKYDRLWDRVKDQNTEIFFPGDSHRTRERKDFD